MVEVEEIGQHWRDAAREAGGDVGAESAEAIDVEPREVTEEEWQRICEAERGHAEKNFGRRNPLA